MGKWKSETRYGAEACILETMPDGTMFGRVRHGTDAWFPAKWSAEGTCLNSSSAYDLIPAVVVSDAVYDAFRNAFNRTSDLILTRSGTRLARYEAALAAAITAWREEQT